MEQNTGECSRLTPDDDLSGTGTGYAKRPGLAAWASCRPKGGPPHLAVREVRPGIADDVLESRTGGYEDLPEVARGRELVP